MTAVLLCTGSAVTKNISSGTDMLTAEAAGKTVDPNTPHNHGYATYYYGHMSEDYNMAVYSRKYPSLKIGYRTVHNVYDVWICLACQRPAKKKLIQSEKSMPRYYTWYLLNPGAYN